MKSVSENEGLRFSRADFPEDFRFGVATSSYQIEGTAFGDCGLSHWDTFAATPGNTAFGENGAIACDHYHRWPEDLDLVRDAGLDCYRFSISWARVQPDGKGSANPVGLDFYDRLVDGMLERKLQPFATLYHWDLPVPLADIGGWTNRDITDRFADYAAIVVDRIGDRLETIATINEPWCVAWLSHFLGHHAPGLRDIRAAARAMHHVPLAHGKAIQAMRSLGMEQLGLVTNFEFAAPASDSPEDRDAADLYDGIYNRWFLEAVFRRAYPEVTLQGLLPHLPDKFELDFDTIAAPIDWLGINYYTRKLIAHDGTDLFPALAEQTGSLPQTEMGWEIYPEGLHHFIMRVQEMIPSEMPIHVTENGMANADSIGESGSVPDFARIDYLNRHLAQVNRAISDGAQVKSYFIWSLLDNFEWALGYDKRFGLVHVDFDTLERTPKQSWIEIKRALATN